MDTNSYDWNKTRDTNDNLLTSVPLSYMFHIQRKETQRYTYCIKKAWNSLLLAHINFMRFHLINLFCDIYRVQKYHVKITTLTSHSLLF